MEKSKYFIALVIPEPFQKEIMGLKQKVRDTFNSKGALRSPAHITLHMPFDWKDEKENVLLENLANFKFKLPLHIELKNFSCFEPRVIFIDVVPNETLAALQKELVRHVKFNLNLFNQANDLRGFHPHVTIAFRDLKKPNFFQAWEHLQGQVAMTGLC